MMPNRGSDELLVERFVDGVLVFDVGTGEIHHLDRAAELIWDVARDVASEAAIVSEVARVVEMSEDDVGADVRRTLRVLRHLGLVGDPLGG